MTKVKLLYSEELLVGFKVSGHATSSADDEQGRLVCSAISSAAFMTANTITEIVGASAEIKQDDGLLSLKVTSNFEEALPILSGFALHIKELSNQFEKYVTIITEV